MRSFRIVGIFLLLSAFVSFGPQSAHACSCMMPGSIQESWDNTDALFLGTVTDIRSGAEFETEVTIAVEQYWKGLTSSSTSVTVQTPRDSAACGFNFEEDVEYLVYADNVDGELRVSLCSATKRADQAAEDFAFLRGDESGGNQQGFADVNNTHEYRTAIEYVQNEGIVEGNPDGTYRPDNWINRAEFTKIIVLSEYSEADIEDLLSRARVIPFPDVPSDAWFADYVYFAAAQGIIAGNPDGTFRPSNNINLAEASKIVAKAKLGTQEGTGELWWVPFVQALQERNAVPFYPDPTHLVTRGEMAEMIYRLAISEDPSVAAQDGCVIKVCSNQLCLDSEEDGGITTCEWREEYACYRDAVCERQPGGTCGWSITPSVRECLDRGGADACLTMLCPADTVCRDGQCVLPEAKYMNYYDGAIQGNWYAVLFFHAPWCPYCQRHDTFLQEKYALHRFDIPTFKVDYDTNTELKTKYGVVQQDTFVLVDGEGNEVSRTTFPSEQELEDFITS